MPKRSELADGWPVWALAVAQTLSYASMYYSFAALILYWHRDLGWAKSTLAQGPTIAILVSAVLAPFVGKLVDKGRGPEAMVVGALLGAISLVGMSMAQTPTHWILAWTLQGIGQILSQYEACFAFLIRRLGPSARNAIIRVTLVADFAGTISIPAYAVLADWIGWRDAMLAGAAVVAGVVVPLNYFATRAIRRSAPPPISRAELQKTARPGSRGRRMVLLSTTYSLLGLNQWMILSFLVPIFVMQGYPETQAIFAAALVGPAQVVGRFALMRFEARLDTTKSMLITILALFISTLILLAAGMSYGVVLTYVVLQGAAVGILTILKPLLIADIMGPEDYGATAGKIQVPSSTIGAFAPMVGALFLEGPGLTSLVVFSLALSVAAYICVKLLQRQ